MFAAYAYCVSMYACSVYVKWRNGSPRDLACRRLDECRGINRWLSGFIFMGSIPHLSLSLLNCSRVSSTIAVRNHIRFRADLGELVTEMPAFVPDLINFVYVWYARWSWRLMPDPELRRTVLAMVRRHFRERNWLLCPAAA